MEAKEIVNFRNSVSDMSLDELNELLKSLNTEMNNMILNSDLIIKIAIVDQKIKEKSEKNGEIK